MISNGVPLRGSQGYGGVIGIENADAVMRSTDVESLARRADAGDSQVLTDLADEGARLGCAIAVLANLLHPAAVLLGGCYARLAPWLLPAVERRLRPLLVAPDVTGHRISASTLGYAAPAVGAAAVALDAVNAALAGPRSSARRE